LRKWSPEPLGAAAPEEGFIPLVGAPEAGLETPFRAEHPQKERDALLDELSAEEREQVYQLVEADVAMRYEECYRQTTQEQKESLQRFLAQFGQSVDAEVKQVLGELARRAVEVAVIMAERIVRQTIDLDPEVLVRTLTTALTKLEAGATMTVTAHPQDVAYLQEHQEILAALRIAEVTADRRIERGGCLLRSRRREWDATLRRQLETLQEVIGEHLVAALGAPEPAGAETAVDESGAPEVAG
jgi:flagellar assembly protein FliH